MSKNNNPLTEFIEDRESEMDASIIFRILKVSVSALAGLGASMLIERGFDRYREKKTEAK